MRPRAAIRRTPPVRRRRIGAGSVEVTVSAAVGRLGRGRRRRRGRTEGPSGRREPDGPREHGEPDHTRRDPPAPVPIGLHAAILRPGPRAGQRDVGDVHRNQEASACSQGSDASRPALPRPSHDQKIADLLPRFDVAVHLDDLLERVGGVRPAVRARGRHWSQPRPRLRRPRPTSASLPGGRGSRDRRGQMRRPPSRARRRSPPRRRATRPGAAGADRRTRARCSRPARVSVPFRSCRHLAQASWPWPGIEESRSESKRPTHLILTAMSSR